MCGTTVLSLCSVSPERPRLTTCCSLGRQKALPIPGSFFESLRLLGLAATAMTERSSERSRQRKNLAHQGFRSCKLSPRCPSRPRALTMPLTRRLFLFLLADLLLLFSFLSFLRNDPRIPAPPLRFFSETESAPPPPFEERLELVLPPSPSPRCSSCRSGVSELPPSATAAGCAV